MPSRCLASVLVALATAACASQPETAPGPVPVTLDASRGRTWDALTELVGTKWGLPTSMANQTSGLIQTTSLHIDRNDVASCSWQAMGGDLFMALNIVVRGDSTHSTVEFTPTFRKVVTSQYGTQSYVCATTQRLESQYVADLKQRLIGA